ncbi:hypothetical protein [Synechococcus sp. 1G10]|uniref:hypothetical protein n=1 Tax=Synechococcus sp. 1G10 TaxID=2025605 RepID=UPI0018E99FBE|nr:hypothetical protein [Synechococcus sp. 1G10]
MKVAVCQCDLIGDHDAFANLNTIGTHENRPNQNAVFTYFNLARWLQVERCPGVDLHAVTEEHSWVTLAAAALEAVAPFDPAALPQVNAGRKVAVIPIPSQVAIADGC